MWLWKQETELVSWEGVNLPLLVLKMKKGLHAKECKKALGPGKDKVTESPLESPEGMKSCWHLDFKPSETHVVFLTYKI